SSKPERPGNCQSKTMASADEATSTAARSDSASEKASTPKPWMLSSVSTSSRNVVSSSTSTTRGWLPMPPAGWREVAKAGCFMSRRAGSGPALTSLKGGMAESSEPQILPPPEAYEPQIWWGYG